MNFDLHCLSELPKLKNCNGNLCQHKCHIIRSEVVPQTSQLWIPGLVPNLQLSVAVGIGQKCFFGTSEDGDEQKDDGQAEQEAVGRDEHGRHRVGQVQPTPVENIGEGQHFLLCQLTGSPDVQQLCSKGESSEMNLPVECVADVKRIK